jgi:hypothetical protein
MSKEENEIAFKDLKKSIGKKEFKAILKLAKSEYKSLKKVLDSANEFEQRTLVELGKDAKEMGVDKPVFLEKVVENLINKARNQIIDLFGEQIERLDDITNFINRFQKPGKEYQELDFSFLNKQNNNNNGKR